MAVIQDYRQHAVELAAENLKAIQNIADEKTQNDKATQNITDLGTANTKADADLAALAAYGNVPGAVKDIADIKTEVTTARGTFADLSGRFSSIITKLNNLSITNVEDFGATGGGTADDTQSFSDAINSISELGGIVYIPAGSYLISSITVNKPITFIGEAGGSTGASQIISKDATKKVFILANEGMEFINLKFTSSVMQTSGEYINSVNNSRINIKNCFFEKYYIALNFEGGSELNITDCQLYNGTDETVASGSCGIKLGENNYTGAVSITNCYIKNEDGLPNTNYGIYLGFVDVVNISATTIINHGNNLHISPKSGQTASLITCVDAMFDTSDNGVSIVPVSGGKVARSSFVNCWFGEQRQTGFVIANSTGSVNGISITNSHILNNKSCGFNADGVNITDINISNNFIGGNLDAGIRLNGTINNININNNTIGECDGTIKNGVGITSSSAVSGTVLGNIFTTNTVNINNVSPTLYIGDNTGLEWTLYTPTVGSVSGSVVNSVAALRYSANGKRAVFNAVITITDNGTGAGGITVVLPFKPKLHFFCGGRAGAISGKALQAFAAPGSNILTIYNFDGTHPAVNGESLIISGQYEFI
jgi:hypothetical protein